MTQQVSEVTPEVIDAVVSAMTPEQFVEAATQAVRSAPSSVLAELTRAVSEERASRDRAERLDTLLNEEAIAATEDVPQRSEWQEQGRRGYPKGFEVVRNGRFFRSTVPANAWSPAELPHEVHPPGWEFVEYLDEEPEVPVESAPDPEPESEPAVPAWASGVTYAPGDRVMHDGVEWVARISHTSHEGWVPSAATHAVWGRV